ncbi:Ig-like domain-containing protein [Rubrimonas cliftonensis]|uniref:VCBS repeat-containing protein n=1 Tax=Rubrimonas cliftonensis TaxID=89524 RepID=A0A1H4G418_9RHOB|nr:Ig-like domain-containing protein [Rubrimonas cliftonensis]SEB03800.1 VCBS repeat-containing protein [Rubrimonas cliftonensis]
MTERAIISFVLRLGLLRIEGDAHIAGRLTLEVGPDGADRIEATGMLDLTGAAIEIIVAEGFDPAAAPALLTGAAVTGLDAATLAFAGPGAEGLSLTLGEGGVVVAEAPPPNGPPVATDDAGEGFETVATAAFDTGDVLSNDADPDPGETLAFLDFDASGAAGAVSYNGDGTFRYDPAGAFGALGPGETALDSFTCRVTDGEAVATATVTVAVTGVAPPLTVIEGAPNAARIDGTAGAEADVFVFGLTDGDGRRDVAYLRDFEQGRDLIDPGGAGYTLRTLGSTSVVTLDTPDRDTLFVSGATLTAADFTDAWTSGALTPT